MLVQAAAGDTWGIPGPTFLLLFIGAAVVIIIASVAHRRRLFAGPRDVSLTDLHPQQAAYLNGGERLAIYTSLGGLRAAGIVGVSDKRLVQTGAMVAGATPLDQAIYNAAGERIRPKTLAGHRWVRAALSRLQRELEAAGLAVTPRARRWARLGPELLGGLLLVGFFRFDAGMENDKPVGLLILTMLVLLVIALVMLLRVPRRTVAATRAVRHLRERHMYLSPSQSPSYATYGVTGAAMGIALFGAGSLYAIDPSFAAAAQVSRHSTYSSSYHGSSGGGSSCGGGSSSCGGGGGGGCGGGGCGG